MLTNDQLAKWDRESFIHPSTHLAQHARGETATRIIKSAEGSFITDRDGNRFLDAFAGLYCVNIGYGRQEVAEAIADQARELAYYHAYVGHGTEASVTLAQMVMDRAPDHMSRVYFGLGGSDANETNVKLVWYYNNILGRPEKKKIISRWRGYHGSGLMSGSLTGLSMWHKKFDLPLDTVRHTTAPYYFRREDANPDGGGVHRPMRRRSGGADRGGGPRHHRRLHRGADAGHGRHRPPARRLLAGHRAHPAQA
jgi:L-2,4-diaminobutyrate transaminase